jgi:hypothetical protein
MSEAGVPQNPRKALWGISEVNFKKPCQVLAINAHKLAPRPPQGLQDRPWNAPTKGLLRRKERAEGGTIFASLFFFPHRFTSA